MPRRPDVLCAGECGRLIWAGSTSLPPGEARCRECRSPWPDDLPMYDRECWWCGIEFGAWKKGQRFCSLGCAARRQPVPGRRLSRVAYRGAAYRKRSLGAPGLSEGRRLKLLAKWRRQGRSCSYCSRPVESVDHVVPLSRGGDNREGNLVPCCLRCNRLKGGRLLVEWWQVRGVMRGVR